MPRKAPYSHPDGSNCWTKNCRRSITVGEVSKIVSPVRDSERISKTMSFALRHKPEKLGLTLDNEGWVDIKQLSEKLTDHFGRAISISDIISISELDTKERYAIEGSKIRANQGHSVSVDLNLKPLTPPTVLYHGTSNRFLASIRITGLQKGARQYVHLSEDYDTAVNVGNRHGGQLVMLRIEVERAIADGVKFYQAQNGVWLVNSLPSKYLTEL